MILDTPDSDEFKSNGIAFLNLAWESILWLYMHFEAVQEQLDEDYDDDEDERDKRKIAFERDYWQQKRQELAVALALTQQGTEFLLKWKISLVSPFLLLSGESSSVKWPGEDKSFADFKTVDAQDLVRIHDTVDSVKLTEEFKQQFEHFRKLRNTVLHSVDSKKQYTAKDGLVAILETVNALLGSKSWSKIRREYYDEKASVMQRHYYHYTDDTLAREHWHALELLEPAQIKRFFDFVPKQRRYLCPTCAQSCSDVGLEFHLAQLKPNSPTSTTIFCVACGETNSIVREDCAQPNCPGNVLSEEYGLCLTCDCHLE